jgi:hypothetical protein
MQEQGRAADLFDLFPDATRASIQAVTTLRSNLSMY